MDQSGQARWSGRGASGFLLPLVLIAAIYIFASGAANAIPDAFPLQLEVSVNGRGTGLIGTFEYRRDGKILAKAGDLRDLGIETGETDPKKWIDLSKIAQVRYSYDQANQSIAFTVAAERMAETRLSARPSSDDAPPLDVSSGVVLNYTLIGILQQDELSLTTAATNAESSGVNAQLETRLFGSYGTISNDLLVGTSLVGESYATRLDTAWSWSDPETLRTWTIGDTVSGGQRWSRPVRIAGAQLRRNFELRPDLITVPLPQVTGTAAVPSTVDIFLNNTKVFSQDVRAGPFSVSDLPAITGAGTAKVILRDAAGSEKVTTTDLFGSPLLLKGGLYDYSVEVGLARRNFGNLSNDYDTKPAAIASWRYGINDNLTVEAHAEARAGLANAGAGFVTQLGNFAVLSMAASASLASGAKGASIYASIQGEALGATYAASTLRSFGDYQDLADVTSSFRSGVPTGVIRNSFKPSRTLDILSVGYPLAYLDASASISFVQSRNDTDVYNRTVTGSLSKRLTDSASLYTTGFHNLETGGTGIYAGLTVSLGKQGSLSFGATQNEDETRFSAGYTKSADRSPGSIGWQIRGNKGQTDHWAARMSYYGRKARLRSTIDQYAESARATIAIDGSVVVAGGDMFFDQRIDDAFAVVDAGAPGVEVKYENRPAGETGSNGKLLLTGLRSYEKNRITIDPTQLPVDAEVNMMEQTVVPADRSGVAVKINVETQAQSALVTFKDSKGAFIPVGSTGHINAGKEPFVVGYDGQAFLRNLKTANTVEINLGDQLCRASFPYRPAPGTQVTIEGVLCR